MLKFESAQWLMVAAVAEAAPVAVQYLLLRHILLYHRDVISVWVLLIMPRA